MPQTVSLTVADFLAAFDAAPEDASLFAAEVARHDFRYRRLEQRERDAVILSVLRKLGTFTQVGEHRHDIWEMAWADVTRRYDDSSGDMSALEPMFISATQHIRLGGEYAVPVDPRFESNFFRVLRQWLFRKYLGSAGIVYEFGCGSGFNLATLAQLAPTKRLVGLDWSHRAVELLDLVAARYGFDLRGRHFDFFHPDPDFVFEPDSTVMTFAALEQTGDRCTDFLDWLLERRPSLVVSMEPTLDFYDPDSLVDELAIRYHVGRHYLSGYLTWLRQQEAAGRVELLKARRLGMGNLYHEGYSLLIWRPT